MDQRVVRQDAAAVGGLDRDLAAVGADPGGPALHELDAGAGEQVRDPVVGQLLARGELVQPQSLGEPVGGVDQGDPAAAAAGAASGADRGHQARVAAAEDQYAVVRAGVRGGGHG